MTRRWFFWYWQFYGVPLHQKNNLRFFNPHLAVFHRRIFEELVPKNQLKGFQLKCLGSVQCWFAQSCFWISVCEEACSLKLLWQTQVDSCSDTHLLGTVQPLTTLGCTIPFVRALRAWKACLGFFWYYLFGIVHVPRFHYSSFDPDFAVRQAMIYRADIKWQMMVVVVMMIVTGGCGCDDDCDMWWWLWWRLWQVVVVVMMIVTDGGGCDDDSDRWWWLWWW